MIETLEITVFVSCPGDVEDEKRAVQDVCNSLNTSAENICNIRFIVKEWRSIIGSYGERAQQQINNNINKYDIYLGIWWMRFGSNTGAINEHTGLEFESGTHEEFVLAYDNWQAKRYPTIYIFKKEPKATNTSEENLQYGKILNFFEDQQKLHNWTNHFKLISDFQLKVYTILNSILLEQCVTKMVSQKQSTLNLIPFNKRDIIDNEKKIIPNEDYINRYSFHFSLINNKDNTPIIQPEKHTLDHLVLIQNRIILLGDAGSGKSTELKSLYNRLKEKDSPLIPLFQSLNTYTPEKGIEGFLPTMWNDLPKDLLILILDGLDEIPPENFNTVVRQIQSFSENYKEIRIIISCRTNFYELPVNSSQGTLAGFEPYFIKDLELNDVKTYYQKKYQSTSIESQKFIEELYSNNLLDLVTKPFFLFLLSDNYSKEKHLDVNRAELYEAFLLNRIELDQNHFSTTYDIKGKKYEIIKLLEKVALSMEILTKNYISDHEILEIISMDEFKSLKYCTAFKKKDGSENIWQFEHNNIQEYLAAKSLVKFDFNTVVKFIAFAPTFNKLIPSWVNTLSFLFSILKKDDLLFENLLKWLLDNDKEVIVKFEADKVSDDIKNNIFQEIFNHYKNFDVWLNSNKFNSKELSRFGQTNANFHFLIYELKNETNSKIVLTNALSLLQEFKTINAHEKLELEEILLNHITNSPHNPNFIHSCIYALKRTEISSAKTIGRLMQIIGKRTNRYIRAAMYALLISSDALEDYVDYLIEGYELLNNNIDSDRGVTLFDEGWNLKDCLQKIKSPSGIIKLINYISNKNSFDSGFDSKKILLSVISNAVIAHKENPNIYKNMLEWFLKDIKNFRVDRTNTKVDFFDETHTRVKAFKEILNLQLDEKDKFLALAKLMNTELIDFTVDQYLKRNIKNNEIETLYYDMAWVGNVERDNFRNLVQEKTDFRIQVKESINYEEIRIKKLNEDFRLLFDIVKFKKEVFRIFEDAKKEILSFDNLFEIRKENQISRFMDDNYSSIALSLLRAFTRDGKHIKIDEVEEWFNNKEKVEFYIISTIYEFLTNNNNIVVSKNQIEFIKTWVQNNITKVDFTRSLTFENGNVSNFSTYALYLFYFSKRFKIYHSKEIMLDLLLFDYFEDEELTGIEYIHKKVTKLEIANRMIENLTKGLTSIRIIKNHIKYLVGNRVKESYPLIINEILNTDIEYYIRIEFLDLIYDATKDLKMLKSILTQADYHIIWSIVSKLKVTSEKLYIETFLLEELNKDIPISEKIKASEELVTLQNMTGLEFYTNWIKDSDKLVIDRYSISCLNSLTTKEAIPYLIELLEISYVHQIKIDPFEYDRFNSYVLTALTNIGLVSEENFNLAKRSLTEFLNSKIDLHDDVKYLLLTIERLETQFYMNRSQTYTLLDVKEKLKLLN